MEKDSRDLKKYVVHPESATHAEPKPIVSVFVAASAILCSTGVFSSISFLMLSVMVTPGNTK